jgi:anti-anti-sigma factor
LFRRGERRIVLDLTRVSKIDAAGVGELVRAYNMTDALDGWLRIAHASAWVREALTRVGLLDLLSLDGDLD